MVRWESEGRLIPQRTPTGRRIYTKAQLDEWVSRNGRLVYTPDGAALDNRRIIAYARASAEAQRPDLQRQREAIGLFLTQAGIANTEIISEIGGGLNWRRPKFLEISQEIEEGKVGKLIVAHKDRWVRFGFEFFEELRKRHNCQLLVINSEVLSPEAEMTQDLMSIMHCFSSRLYGLRKYATQRQTQKIIK
jgi:predicted site-specific integrase-resolvase